MWETVIGVEIHVQLQSERKLFCGDLVSFGDPPNSHVCPVCLGLPGALPTLNPEPVALAVRTALALECTVHPISIWARKHYFYPDLPKGYQITQFARPLATAGRVRYDSASGEGEVRIRRVHMEEDAGKSMHDRIAGATAVDLNRAGTPLVEIVTEPDLRSPEDVRAFLTDVKRLLEFAGVSDCSMEEGSLRVDANISLRRRGDRELGTKTEIKNVNSFSGIEKALRVEIDRQTAVLEDGGVIDSTTLLWDDHHQRVRVMRSKEESDDYRYFPEPDLPELGLDPAVVESARANLPELPRPRRERLREEYGLSLYDAGVLTQSRDGADYFEATVRASVDPKAAANWVMGPAQALMNTRGESVVDFPVRPPGLAELIGLVTDGTISDGVGKRVLETMARTGATAHEIVSDEGLEQVRDLGEIARLVDVALSDFPDEAARLKDGEQRLLGFLVGQVMRASDGNADPGLVREAITARLS